ncbi:MAG: class I SAM-dependent methyltransferase [Bacteroidales bacterium]|nr:class I SAM-dependent methyltransferase [Bacteroidales bacterium]
MQKLKDFYHFLSPKFQNLFSEYKIDFKPRYGHGKSAHAKLLDIIEQNRKKYADLLNEFIIYKNHIQSIKKQDDENLRNLPVWNNGFLPGLDIIGIYGMVARFHPKVYLEIGSGNSTKVVRKTISDQQLDTQITSIDPFPRASIDHLADHVIRKPLERFDDFSFIYEELGENDILFIDNSHRCFPNSDVMVCFQEILPYLKKGVIVHIHDIYIPYDYPQFMCDAFYSEQYLLATALLWGSDKFDILLPNYFISEDNDLKNILLPLWDHQNLEGVERHGGSFWYRVK